jgi:hypothetical protein
MALPALEQRWSRERQNLWLVRRSCNAPCEPPIHPGGDKSRPRGTPDRRDLATALDSRRRSGWFDR